MRGWARGAVVLEIVAAVGIGGLVVVAAAASLLLRGPAHRMTRADRAALAELGLRPDRRDEFVGTLAGLDVRIEPDPGTVRITAAGLDEGLVIEAQDDGPTFGGTFPATRSRRERAAALCTALGSRLEARHRTLRFDVPTFVATSGQLPSTVKQLEALLQDLVTPVDWVEVVRDPKEELALRLAGLRHLAAMDGPTAQRAARDLLDDPEPVVQWVAQAVGGDFAPLEAHCRDEVAQIVVPVLGYLQPPTRAAVVAYRVAASEKRAQPFSLDLLERLERGEVPHEELMVLVTELHAALLSRDTMSFAGHLAMSFAGAVAPFAAVLEALGRSETDIDPAWVELAIGLLTELEGDEGEVLMKALMQTATIADVAALRRCDRWRAEKVIEHLQEQVGDERGGLALAEALGGELALAAQEAVGVPPHAPAAPDDDV